MKHEIKLKCHLTLDKDVLDALYETDADTQIDDIISRLKDIIYWETPSYVTRIKIKAK